MMDQASEVADYYSYTQQDLFYLLIDTFKTTHKTLIAANADPQKILEWRLQALSKMGALTKQVIDFISKNSGVSKRDIFNLIENNGLTIAKQMNKQLASALKKPLTDVSSETKAIIHSYAEQAWSGVNNYVNQALISRNYQKNPALKAYQEIVDKTTLDVITSNKTAERALFDNVYKWHDAGMQSTLIDKAGHHWSLEGYTRMCVETTTHRVFNQSRINSMKDFDTVLATMTSHPAARPACAPIQGKIVCIVPKSDPRCIKSYPNIYDHGYGTPAGTQGINCSHMLYPYIRGVSHNFQKEYDPKKAVNNMKIQQQQRRLERCVRKQKQNLELAKKQGDQDGIGRFSASVRGYQAKLRQIVKNNNFLVRDYSREKIVTN